MPIRFVDRAATVVGRVATTLADVSPNFDGTFTTAPARTGTISAQMQDHSAQLSGIFQSNANRVGTIGTVLGNHVASFLGGGAVQPGTGITTFSILGTQTTTQRWTFLHAFRPGDVPPGNYVSADFQTFQSQVLSRWRDGSAKLVSIAGRKAVSANVASSMILGATQGTQPGAALTEAQLITFNPQVSVAFTGGISATVTLASLLGQTSTGAHTSNGLVRTHITGPQMSEFHYRSQVGSDASLAVWFYVRFYGDDAEIEIAVENTRLTATLAQKSYTIAITVNGTSRYSSSHSHWARASFTTCQWYNTGTSGTGDYSRVIPLHNTDYLISTGLVPPCAQRTINAATFSDWGTTFTPLGGGMFGSQDFSGVGYAPWIGLMNNFDFGHLMAPSSQTYTAMMRNQLAFKSWPVNMRDETTGSPLRPATYPNAVFPNNSGWSGGQPLAEPSNSTSTFTWNAGGGQTNAHLPAAGYFAYLVTGRWHFAEDCTHWALRGYFDTNPDSRTTFSQLTLRGGRFQERAKAWMFRSTAQAALCYPDSPPRTADANLRADLLAMVGQQMTYWEANGIGTAMGFNKDGYRVTPPQDFRWLNFPDSGFNYTSTDLPIDPWQENMRVAAVGFAWDMDLPISDAQRDSMRRVRDDWYKYPVGLTGDGNNFCFRSGGNYRTVAASTNGTTVTPLASWRAAYLREQALGNIPSQTCNLTDAWLTDSSMQGNHGIRLPALSYAVKHQAVGAAEALNRMKSSSTWTTFSQCLASSDGTNPLMNYVLPESAPSWFTVLVSSRWSSVAANDDIDAVEPGLANLPMPPGSPAAGSPPDFTGAWSGACFDEDWLEYVFNAAGGHANYWGNEGYAFSLRRSTPKWRRYIDPTPAASAGNPEQTGSLLADGRSRAMHCTFVSWGAGKIVYSVQNSVTSGGGGSVKQIAVFNKQRLGYCAVSTPYNVTSGYPMSGVNLWTLNGDPFSSNPSMLNSGKFGVSAYDKLSSVTWSIGGDGENNQPYWAVTHGSTVAPLSHGSLPFSTFGMCRANAVACSPDVHLYVVLSSRSNEIAFLDLNNQGLGWAKPTATSGTAPAFASLGSFNIPSQNIAMVYYERARQFLLADPRRLGSTVYVLTPPRNADGSFNRTGTWAWRTVTSPAVTFTNDGGHESTYTKLQICQEMGDGRGCLIFCGSIDGPTYIYPLPATGL
jgi:hypothetical protein